MMDGCNLGSWEWPVTSNGCPPWSTTCQPAWTIGWLRANRVADAARGGWHRLPLHGGPCSWFYACTMVPSDSVLQSLNFRNAVKTIGSGNVRVKNTPPPTSGCRQSATYEERCVSTETGIILYMLLCPKVRMGFILDSLMCFHMGESEMVHIIKLELWFHDHHDKLAPWQNFHP